MLDTAIRAIAEPRRREILLLAWEQEMSAGEISAHFDVTRPAVSQHLKVLVEAGLVTLRKEGTRRFYKTRPEGLSELRVFLEGFWGNRLRLLKQMVESEEREGS